MSCREFEADVVDLARGAGMDAASAARLTVHLERCPECAARVSRERQLTMALKATADVPPSARAAAIEAQLLAAFAERQVAASAPVASARSPFASPAARGWLAAAAVLVLGVAVWQGASPWRTQPAATGVSAADVVRPEIPAQTVAGSSAGADAPVVAARLARPARVQTETAVAVRQPAPGAAARSAQPQENGVMRFVTLPTAIGLPAIESGRIVRVEVPTAMLPAYGLDVAPDSAAGMVEADVLVGQDGQPRAIRFVTLDSDPRRRQ
jgi:hypothetical protein